jgi:TonB family protein
MNTNTSCDRFEREGLLSMERGLPLDAHFSSCADCKGAQAKHACILAALPLAEENVRMPIGWQQRVLRATAPNKQEEKRHETPEIFAFVGLAAMVVAAFFGVVKRGSLDAVDVTADWNGKAPSNALTDDAVAPNPDNKNEPNDKHAAVPQKMPAPVAPAPRRPRKEVVAPMLAMPEETRNLKNEAPIVAAPDTAPMVNDTAPTTATPHKVVRPSALYGFTLQYPKAARDAKVQGETSVQCTIRKDGKNTNCRVLKSLPFLDEYVLSALAAATSDPIKVDGKPVDNSDHIWHITITLRDPIAPYTTSRGLPIVSWKNSAP